MQFGRSARSRLPRGPQAAAVQLKDGLLPAAPTSRAGAEAVPDEEGNPKTAQGTASHTPSKRQATLTEHKLDPAPSQTRAGRPRPAQNNTLDPAP